MATKLKLKIGAEAAKVEATAGFSQYVGEVPPRGIYRARVKSLSIKPNKAKTKDLLVAVIEFDTAKDDPASKYNGYAIFERMVIPESMSEENADLFVGKINRLLDAMAGNTTLRNQFWGGGTVMDDKGEKVLKIGSTLVSGKKFQGIKVVVSARDDNYKRKSRNAAGKVVAENVRSLRVNDVYPADHEMPSKVSDEDLDALDEEAIDVDDADLEVDEGDGDPDEVITVDDDGEVETVPDPEDDGPEPETVPDPEDDDPVYDPDDDPEEPAADPEPEPEPEPEAPKKASARKRRSAF
ncbi:hypothetical protein SEA_PATIO_66 [Gordonia phage Patio]|uniref:Uncharacterized protein n=1 Tax=Gordonia phage Patio TaxID=2041515 RepID=A0A2D2W4M3_9CAUD|nr:hypothetical protein KNT76_gp66 [Gordonia phage Patio]ATS93147.1 hypothetical protein SEA_PATIO_66 [Gordonia phage Patio]